MRNNIKRLYEDYKPFIKGVISALSIMLIYDWIIAPGLTVDNTVINLFSFIGGSLLILFVGLSIWENLFKNDKTEKKWQETHSETNGNLSNKDNEKSMNKDNETSNN